MDSGIIVVLAIMVAIFSVMAWWQEALLILNSWEPVPETKNPFKVIGHAFKNVGRAIKNSAGLASDILITSWAASIGGAGSTLGFLVGLIISDVISIYICSYMYKVSPGRAIIGIITSNFQGKTKSSRA